MAEQRSILPDTRSVAGDNEVQQTTRREPSGGRRAHPQGKYWLLTIPQHKYTPFPHPLLQFAKGQMEQGAGGFLHWQVMVGFKKKVRLTAVKNLFGPECHAELSRSEAAEDYVWKDDTFVEGTRFELVNVIKYLRCVS